MTYSHRRADCLYTGSAPGPTLGNQYGKHVLYHIVSYSALLKAFSFRRVCKICEFWSRAPNFFLSRLKYTKIVVFQAPLGGAHDAVQALSLIHI